MISPLLNGHDARHYASEGQQKGVVLALRLAEFSYLQKKLGMVPILLADDVLGELDSDRRSNFRKLLPPTAQTFATGTAFPSQEEEEIWETFQVSSGNFTILIPSAKMDDLSTVQWAVLIVGSFIMGLSKGGIPGAGNLTVALFVLVLEDAIGPTG